MPRANPYNLDETWLYAEPYDVEEELLDDEQDLDDFEDERRRRIAEECEY